MKERRILKNKLFLYMTEFFSGMSVMAVELGASRLLAPYFSSSQIVWTIIIGTIMIAMALGNIFGGRSADKNPDPDRLYLRVLLAAVWIALIPLVGKYVIAAVTAVLALFVKTNFLVWAAFAACMILFVFPLLLLGTVTPSLVKYTVDSLDDSGKTVGALGALNTVGSIIGTFMPTFVTIPAVGTSATFLIFAGILLALCAVYFFSGRVKPAQVTAGIVVFVLCCVFGSGSSFAFWDEDVVLEDESIYNYLQVKETEESVTLSTNVMFGVQSIMMKSDELTGMYYDYALAALPMAGIAEQSAAEVLILGMGTGTYATQSLRYYPNLSFEGVEIDEKIAALAHEYFALPETVEITTYDGRAYLDATDKTYDVIMVDAYQDITIPFQMSSVEFFTLVYDHLRPGGVMVVNMNMYSGDAGSINEYLSDTIASVFDEVYTVNVSGNTNCELFAVAGEGGAAAFESTRAEIENTELAEMMQRVADGLTAYDGGNCIFTDDKAPVELLGMRAIDEIIGDELTSIRGIYSEQGIDGLLQLLG
ncbi:MAG: fused MFS/spermidine synthase [Oscillospiraceae bacterium]|nr:fused MFS/spermidine synthase [Oscillospiraceae bacterium]